MQSLTIRHISILCKDTKANRYAKTSVVGDDGGGHGDGDGGRRLF